MNGTPKMVVNKYKRKEKVSWSGSLIPSTGETAEWDKINGKTLQKRMNFNFFFSFPYILMIILIGIHVCVIF